MDGSALDEGTHVVLQNMQKAHTSFAGGPCYVWRKKDVWSREKGIMRLRRFGTQYVGSIGREEPRAKSISNSLLVHHCPTACIDEYGAGPHQGEGGIADEMMCGRGKGTMQRDNMTAGPEGVPLELGNPQGQFLVIGLC